ncbi:hypothetical protein ACO0KD_09525 [Enterococcus avium]|uniref:hypothetical protein n=1 Tax=Enterococcus avium TaxID=33945 RepID=UPI003BF47F98
MSKKVVWIWSTNANQGFRGFATTFGMLVRPYKFQKEVREALAPEWEVEFISDDISEDEISKGDATICSRAMAIYLDKYRYHNLVVIPELELMQYDYSAIKERIAEYL